MSRSFAGTLDHIRIAKSGPKWADIFNAIKAFFEAVEKGRSARHAYAELTAHGVAPPAAAEVVFDRYFAKK